MRGRSPEPKTGYRFGFHGKHSIETTSGHEATVDEILESLGRHSMLSDQLGPRENSESGEGREDVFGGPISELTYQYKVPRSLGRYSFGLMLVGGVLILAVYGLMSTLGASVPSIGVGRSLLLSVLGDPVRLGLLGILCLVPIVMLRKRRGRVANYS